MNRTENWMNVAHSISLFTKTVIILRLLSIFQCQRNKWKQMKSEWNNTSNWSSKKHCRNERQQQHASINDDKKEETWIINTYSVIMYTWIPYCIFITIDLVALCKNALVLPPSSPISDCNDYFCRYLANDMQNITQTHANTSIENLIVCMTQPVLHGKTHQ